jgi:hypothetical protein
VFLEFVNIIFVSNLSALQVAGLNFGPGIGWLTFFFRHLFIMRK